MTIKHACESSTVDCVGFLDATTPPERVCELLFGLSDPFMEFEGVSETPFFAVK
jgi:hypothetical protein